jgi:hypothetical protein
MLGIVLGVRYNNSDHKHDGSAEPLRRCAGTRLNALPSPLEKTCEALTALPFSRREKVARSAG